MAKILIVDDSETTRTQLKNDLGEGGHQVIEAQNGLQGLSQLSAHKDVQLIICDVNMPEMDGLTMCSKVHENEAINKIPILMLTTENGADLKSQGKENGVIGWLVKPFVGKKLLVGVEKVLERYPVPSATKTN